MYIYIYINTPLLTDIDINRPWHDHVIMHDILSYFTMLNCLSMMTLITEIDIGTATLNFPSSL